jgi:hypothetical protein
MNKPIVFLTTSSIFHSWPDEDDAVPMYVFPEDEPCGGMSKVYSTGKLEKLLAEGKRPVVLSSRPKFGEHDAWWRALLPENDVHCTLLDRHVDGGSFTAICKNIVEQVYGLTWPMEPVSEWRPEEEPMFWTDAIATLNKQQEGK